MFIFGRHFAGQVVFCAICGTWSVALAAPPAIDPGDESTLVGAPAAPQVVGAVPPTQVANGTVVTVTGSTTPALISNGLTGGEPNAIVVNGAITANNLNGTGLGVVTAQNGGTIDLGSGTVINGQGTGSASGIIGATGIFGRTAAAGGLRPTVVGDNVTMNISSDRAYGAYAHADSTITLTGLTTLNITTQDIPAPPQAPHAFVLVSNAGGRLTVQDATMTVSGSTTADITAVSAYYNSVTTVTGLVQMSLDGGSITGIFARGAGSVTTVNNVTGTMHGTDSVWGIVADTDSATTVTGTVNLTMTSDTSVGAVGAYARGVTRMTGSSTISATAPTGNGIEVSGGGTVELDNSQLTLNVGSGAAVLSAATAAATASTITVNNSTLASSADGIVVEGGTATIAFNSVTMTNGSGKAISVADTAGAAGTLNFTATNSTLTGYATTAAGSTSTVTLVDTLWNLTGNSNLTTLTNDPSLIDFSAPVGDPTLLSSYKTLTVVNYIGDGGQIALNTYLAGDGSPSDMLVIDGGSATGTTGLIIRNSGGTGAETTGNGILVVDAINGGTTTANAFSLVSPVVAGPYEYDLFRSSLDGTGPENWYLRSTYRPDVSLISVVTRSRLSTAAPSSTPIMSASANGRWVRANWRPGRMARGPSGAG